MNNAVGQEYLRRGEAGFVNSSHYTATGLLAHQRAGRGSDNFLQSLQHNPHQPPFCTDVHRSYQYDLAHNVVRIEDDGWKQPLIGITRTTKSLRPSTVINWVIVMKNSFMM